MENLVALVVVLLHYYLVFAIMAIGFATMVSGPKGAKAAARCFFLGPIVLLLKGVRGLARTLFR